MRGPLRLPHHFVRWLHLQMLLVPYRFHLHEGRLDPARRTNEFSA